MKIELLKESKLKVLILCEPITFFSFNHFSYNLRSEYAGYQILVQNKSST